MQINVYVAPDNPSTDTVLERGARSALKRKLLLDTVGADELDIDVRRIKALTGAPGRHLFCITGGQNPGQKGDWPWVRRGV